MTTTTSDPPDLKKSKAQFFAAAAKLLGVLTLALVPALVGWIDAKAKAASALTAVASERAVGEKTYTQLAERLNETEVRLQALTAQLELLKTVATTAHPVAAANARLRPPRPPVRIERVVVDAQAGDAEMGVIGEVPPAPQPPLPAARPTVDLTEVNAARQDLLQEQE